MCVVIFQGYFLIFRCTELFYDWYLMQHNVSIIPKDEHLQHVNIFRKKLHVNMIVTYKALFNIQVLHRHIYERKSGLRIC